MPELTRAVNALTEEIQRLEGTLTELDRRYGRLERKWNLRGWIAGGTALIVVAGFGASTIVQSVLIERNNTKICRLLDLQATDKPPPMTERARYTAAQAKKIRADAGCD